MKEHSLSIKEKAPFIILEKGDLFDSYDVCKYNMTRPATNLSKINIKVNFKKKLEEYPNRYKLEVFYEDSKMKKVKTIGEGGFGKVVLYEVEHNNKLRSVVVKLPTEGTDPYEEPDILKDYMEKAAICNHYVIPIRTVTDKLGNPFIIMQQANGTIDGIELDPRLKTKLIIQLAKILQCFYKNGFVYTDLKAENILYRCEGGKINFFLGDIGSFEKLGAIKKGSGISYTFVPPEFAYGDVKNKKASYGGLLYVFGATIADIYGLAKDLVYSDNSGKDYTKEDILKKQLPLFRKKIKAGTVPKEIKEIIIAFTSDSPKKREKYGLDYVFEMLCPR